MNVAYTERKNHFASFEAFKVEAPKRIGEMHGLRVKSIKYEQDDHVYTAHATLKTGAV